MKTEFAFDGPLPCNYLDTVIETAPELLMGIDPGQSGGIAILTPQGEIVGAYPMPETRCEIMQLIAEFAPRIARVALEKVGPMPKQGIASTAKFMRGYGFLQGVLDTLQLRTEDVRPQVWQTALSCRTGGKKAITRQKAQQLWPKSPFKITDKIADALLLAEWLRRQA